MNNLVHQVDDSGHDPSLFFQGTNLQKLYGEERSPERAQALMTVGTPLRKGKDDVAVFESSPYS